jgi:alginate O-acetyltransferase complex protein AlgI
LIFNSEAFLLFAAIFFLGWHLVRSRDTLKFAFIILMSFVFYSFWDVRFLFLFIVIGVADFTISLLIFGYPHLRKTLLTLSVVNTVCWLLLFKYNDFIAANINMLIKSVGLSWSITPIFSEWMMVVPVGLSFYSFMSISYVIDTYKSRITPTRNLLHYLAYLCFFPHLMAGPIIRAKDLLSHMSVDKVTTEEQRWGGLVLISVGFFKKMVIADNLAPTVDAAFASPHFVQSGIHWWAVTILFACQIYCDFSGYSDIAIGLFKWMGYDIPPNFNHPYLSRSLREFWRRWHISLSTWFRDYVYVPLGGSRGSTFAGNLLSLWITFLLSGLWHGAAWSFIVWGALHAFYLTLERLTKWPERLARIPFGACFSLVVTLIQVLVAWVFFRAGDFEKSVKIVSTMFTDSSSHVEFPFPMTNIWVLLFVLIAWECIHFFYERDQSCCSGILKSKLVQEVTIVSLLLASVYFRGPGHVFIYFQF